MGGVLEVQSGETRQMHMAGASVREIATALQVGKGTIQRFLAQKPNTPTI